MSERERQQLVNTSTPAWSDPGLCAQISRAKNRGAGAAASLPQTATRAFSPCTLTFRELWLPTVQNKGGEQDLPLNDVKN
ncbi:hypothetical protein H920_03292 [Fukomys damarensis]|uniref:Uncharacterized protein n=1 Tax=Fukomys damarensis TaxID=885580 RepID=A0A091DW58_FUKDA|nr:hypothetical protein H920_03292 [Fukomys damarensis]